ncbi:hypothetical protein ACFY3G_02620 [Streptomyces phaeochromogenes]|uniref:hypothetical protein n=1 Tax=Streptomyces phaeochromogenes TaxID=1923 RepID=UPI00367707DF
MPSMNFLLTGQDGLSRVFDGAGDSARRFARRMHAASMDADRSVRTFTRNTSTQMAGLRRDTDAGGKAIEELGKVTKLLAPAAVPAAASLLPIAAGAGTVAIATLAMTAALVPQIGALSEAAEKEKAYEEAVAKSGARSQDAVAAHTAYVETIAKLPPETREAAAALGILKDSYKQWSDGLAGDTMAPVTKGIAILNGLLPKTTGLVKVTAAETDRLMTVIGGSMESPGLDRLNTKFTNFAQKTLRGLNDQLVHLLRVGDTGEVGGKASEFMEWARAQGPTVASVLNSVAESLIHVLDGASGVGVSLLQIIDVAAGLVSAVPPGAIAAFLQLALAMKLTKVAVLGLAAGRAALAAFGGQLVAMNTAAAATPGRLAAVRASVLALSRTTKIAMAGTGIGLALLAISEIAERSKNAPPDVDRLTTSLRELGSTGRVTGEASKHFGADLDGLRGKVKALTDPSTTDKVQQFLVGWTGWDSTPVKDAKENIGAVDKALANLVKDGQSDLAAAALKRLTAEYGKGGKDTAEFTGKLKSYKSALADAKFEQELAAQSMGLFGAQAQSVQTKLAAQKQSADGLRQSIQALSDTSRSAFDAQTKFEAAVDAVSKSIRENGKTLDVGTEKGRANRDALSQMATATQDAAAKARENGASWETVTGIYDKGRKTLVDNITAITGNRTAAKSLADQLLKMPSPKMRLQMDSEDAKSGLKQFNAAVKATPGAKSVTLKTLSKSAEAILEGFGYKVKRLPDGRVTVTAKAGKALSDVRNVKAAVDQLRNKSITIFTKRTTRYVTEYQKKYLSGQSQHDITGATGGLFTGSNFTHRGKGYAGGGLVNGPGTGTSDSVFAPWLSAKEFVVNARQTAKNLPLLRAINDGTLGAGSLTGGVGGAGGAAAQGLASGMTGSSALVVAAARKMAAGVSLGIREELQISSPSKKTTALAKHIGSGLVKGMTGSRDKIKATSKALAKDIWSAFSGTKDNKTVAWLNRQTSTQLWVAGRRDALAAKIKVAKDFAESTRVKAKQDAGLGGMFGGEEEVTAGGIKGQLAARLAKMKTFSSYIATLAKRGLNRTMLREILEMGPEQGYAYASALAGADKATFNSINSTQYKINDQAEKLGRSGADALYDSGKNASKGFLKGLESEKAALEKTMVRIAKHMQQALRNALGIHSPATEMEPDGVNTARGIGVGVIKGIPYVAAAMDTVAAHMVGRAAETRPVLGRPSIVGRGGGGTTIHIHVDGAVVDKLGVAKAVREALLEFKRNNGGGSLGLA